MGDGWWTPAECRRVERLCAGLTGDHQAAPDLAQETLLEAWRARERLETPEAPGPWLDAVARNVCHRWRVRSARRGVREQLAEQPPAEEGHDPLAELLERDELVGLLERALAFLPPETRSVLVARYVEEQSAREIADRAGTSADAVLMRLTRGRSRLRQVIETDLADDPLAQVWLARHGVAWRSTSLPCAECGRAATVLRRDPRRAVVELRCDRCPRNAPEEVGAGYPLDNPTLGPLLGGLTRPSALVARAADWGERYWAAALAAGAAPCTRCGRRVRLGTYCRPEHDELRTRRGWHVSCPHCGEVATVSVAGRVLHHPTTRRVRARRPALRAVGERSEVREGRAVTVVSFRDPGSGEGVDAVVEADGEALGLLELLPVG